MISSLEVKEVISEGNKASAMVHYVLQTPTGRTFTSKVAEFFTIEDNEITQFSIIFDTALFTKAS